MDRTFLPLLATVMVLVVNAAANIVPINGLNTGELSDLYPTGFTPPGYVFGIWSVIYLGLLSFGIAAWRGAPRLWPTNRQSRRRNLFWPAPLGRRRDCYG